MLEEVFMRLFRPLAMAFIASFLIGGRHCGEPLSDAVAEPGPLVTLL